MCSRLYIIVRSDLPPGLQAAQACHALREFGQEHPEVDADWFANSKTLVLLAAQDKAHLETLLDMASSLGIDRAKNFEPDLGGELTAVALGEQAKKMVRQLPLLLGSPSSAQQPLQQSS